MTDAVALNLTTGESYDAHTGEQLGTAPEPISNPDAQTTPKQERKPRTPRAQKPTVGRIIHIVCDAPLAAKLNCTPRTHVAAIIVGVFGRTLNATAFSPWGNPPVNGLPLSFADEDGETYRERSWHWPERD